MTVALAGGAPNRLAVAELKAGSRSHEKKKKAATTLFPTIKEQLSRG